MYSGESIKKILRKHCEVQINSSNLKQTEITQSKKLQLMVLVCSFQPERKGEPHQRAGEGGRGISGNLQLRACDPSKEHVFTLVSSDIFFKTTQCAVLVTEKRPHNNGTWWGFVCSSYNSSSQLAPRRDSPSVYRRLRRATIVPDLKNVQFCSLIIFR